MKKAGLLNTPPEIRMTEIQLIEGCLANERFAQKELYDRYKDAMFTLAYRISGDFGLAEEILQDAFLKVFRGLGSFRKESTLGAWIKTILVRTAYNKIRKKIRFSSLDYLPADEHIHWGSSLDTEYLEKAIVSLPDGYRSVFVLIEVEGYGHKEVSEMLGISEGTSKSQLFHAKKKLRSILEQMD